MKIRERYQKIKLFCGILYRDEDIVEKVKERLTEKIGEIDLMAGPFPFTFTDYYQKEMGDNLKRRFVSFKNLVSPEDAYIWKHITNDIEGEFFVPSGFPRAVNLDPGYINLSHIVLFSTKDFYHRIYLGKGIFAEVTLYYEKGRYNFLPWTYTDYKTQGYLDFFTGIRNIYKEQLKNEDMVKGTD
ncbi:MAG: DUF4416 family protein [Candidatus Omnitrophica bacterium]|nr:DUF4416 family protein [Candidatus Omnitrophota bacterium]